MGRIECCEHQRLSINYDVEPAKGFMSAVLKVIYNNCPICGHFIVELERINIDGEKSIVRKINNEAYKFYDKIEPYIIRQVKNVNNVVIGKFYLNYSEYGKKKRCYSNLTTLKMGLFDNFDNVSESKYLKAV